MLLKEILAKFENPRKAAEVGRMGYRLSLRWYDRGIKRLIPPMHVLVAWAEHLDLSNADLGELIRDGELERMRLTSKIKMKHTRESEVEIQVEKHRRSLNRDIQQLDFEAGSSGRVVGPGQRKAGSVRYSSSHVNFIRTTDSIIKGDQKWE